MGGDSVPPRALGGQQNYTEHSSCCRQRTPSAQYWRKAAYGGTPQQITSCPWCGSEIHERHLQVYEAPSDIGRCVTYCGDDLGRCEFSEAKAPKEGLPVMVVDEEIYRRPRRF